MQPGALAITRIDAWPVDIPLTDPFAIARGTLTIAESAYVRVTLANGVRGYGEMAPFTALTGETRTGSLGAAQHLRETLLGQPVTHYRALSASLACATPEQPAARCGLETAMLDAFCRALGLPLWAFWGGARAQPARTDVTLPILDAGRILELAAQWRSRGFDTLKLKVGRDPAAEIALVQELASRHPDVAFIFDANQGYNREQALDFIAAASATGCRIRLFEQPVAREDLAGMAWLRARTPVPIAADEAVFSARDALRVIEAGAADIINLKIMKSGVLETLYIAEIARAAGLGLMIGGMVESRLAMGCSLALVMGIGGIEHLDLDTPLLLATDPLTGGYGYCGPDLSVCEAPGLGMTPRVEP